MHMKAEHHCFRRCVSFEIFRDIAMLTFSSPVRKHMTVIRYVLSVLFIEQLQQCRNLSHSLKNSISP